MSILLIRSQGGALPLGCECRALLLSFDCRAPLSLQPSSVISHLFPLSGEHARNLCLLSGQPAHCLLPLRGEAAL